MRSINVTIQETAGSQSRKKGENKRKNMSRGTDTDGDGDGVHQPQPLLVRCSSSSEDKVNKKKKKRQELIPMNATITKHISITKTVTLTTAPENPESELCLYLCLEKAFDRDGHRYRWCKIDLMRQSSKLKSKSKSKPMFLPTISCMPIDTPSEFCVVASYSGPFSMKKRKKLVYAVGGIDKKNDDKESVYKKISSPYHPLVSAKAFVCDFGSKSLTWEELPPMSSPKTIHFGVVSPSDGKLYAYGDTIEKVLEGDVFDPASHSWTSCPPPPIAPSVRVEDHVFDKNRNKLMVFTNSDYAYSCDLTTLLWRSYLHSRLTPPSHDPVSSSVVVGDTLYTYHLGELYALDKSSPSPSFELVPGLAKKVESYMRNREFAYKSYLSYLGKGKFALVWGDPSFRAGSNRVAVYIFCLTFWVGVGNRSNRRRVLIDQRQEYFADGHFLHDCMAL